MASESLAHSFLRDEASERIALEGLDGFFIEDDQHELFSKGLSIKQAVFYYGDTRRALKAKVLQGEIPAIRLPESHGRKWRVFPDGVPAQLQYLIPKKLKVQDAAPPALEPGSEKPVSIESPDAAGKSRKRKKKSKKNAAQVLDSKTNEPDPAIELIESTGLETATPGSAPPALYLEQALLETLEKDPREENETMTQAQIHAEDLSLANTQPAAIIEAEKTFDTVTLQSIAEPTLAAPPEMSFVLPAKPVTPEADLQQSDTITTSEQGKKSNSRIAQLQEKIHELEKNLEEIRYRNNYLEARLTGLEDQVKFLSQNQYQSRQFNKLLLAVPGLVLLAALFIFRMTWHAQVLN